MPNLKLEAPWYTFQKKIKALFEQDPEIKVSEIYQLEEGNADYCFDLEVKNHEKYLALNRVFPRVKEFGNVTLCIFLYDEENGHDINEAVTLYETIFKGNPIVKDVRSAVDHAGTMHGFVRFQPEVIQFHTDDISSYNGTWSGLAQDIAKEVFKDDFYGVHFCTAEKDVSGKPASERP